MTQPTHLGKYQIRRELGQGAMGKVYEAWDPVIERRVAIKVIRAEALHDDEAMDARARFRREAQASGRLSHPCIVQVHEYVEAEGTAYIVMEFAEGQVLRALMRSEGSFSLVEIFVMLRQLLQALDYSHAQGVIHRDIKPANIIVTEALKLKLMDFGIARIGSASLTQVGTLVGTPAYAAPEQIGGKAVDGRADLWSVAVLLYELLTGRNPFRASTLAEMIHNVMNLTPCPPSSLNPDLTPALDELILSALARNPADRIPSARVFLQRLTRILRGRGINPDELTRPATSQPEPPTPAPSVPLPPAEPTQLAPRLTLAAQTLAALEQDLTAVIGPVARILVRNSVERASTLEGLFESLAAALPDGQERTDFLRRCLSRQLSAPGPQPCESLPATPEQAGPLSGGGLPSDDLAAAERLFASHVGPLARILMRDALGTSTTLQDLYRKLAAHIADPADRQRFLDALARPAD